MKRKKVYVHSENRAEQLVKTATNKRGTYVYRFYGKEAVGGKEREFIEEVELIPGEDDITDDDIKKLYAAEDSEVYYNLKARHPQRTAEEKQRIAAWKAEYIRKFTAEHGYKPNQADVNDAANEMFPKNWSTSLDEIMDGDSDDDSAAGDKSAILAKAYRSYDSEPGAVEVMDDPLTKPGIVGTFCRAYGMAEAIDTFLSDIYAPSSMENRYDYIPADSAAGVVIYGDKFAYSHHATDPVCGKLLNAFDLVRLHKFAGLDDKYPEDTPVTKLPSYKAMSDMALQDGNVKALLAQERMAQAADDFAVSADWQKNLTYDKAGNLQNTPLLPVQAE